MENETAPEGFRPLRPLGLDGRIGEGDRVTLIPPILREEYRPVDTSELPQTSDKPDGRIDPLIWIVGVCSVAMIVLGIVIALNSKVAKIDPLPPTDTRPGQARSAP